MRIAVDAGHGSNTEGKRTPPMPKNIDFDGDGTVDIKKGDRIREHTADVGVSYLLLQELKRCGFDTVQTGFNDDNPYDDEDTALSVRQSKIAKAKCDYSICVHFNASGDGETFNSAEGVEVYIHDKYSSDSEKLAAAVLKYLAQGTTQKNRGINKASLAMCNCNSLNVKGAILVEVAFMTNEREATQLMGSKKFWKETAQEICKGICEYTGVPYKEEITMPTKKVTKTSPQNDIKWMQQKLNAVLTGESFIPLTVDGVFRNKTRIAVLIYWEKLGWDDNGTNTGWSVGTTTLNALAKGRTE